jgi:hypothetical protein
MRAYPDPIETLHDPEVKKYFLALLNSAVPAEEKYQAFIRFFEIESDLASQLQAHALASGSGGQKTMDEAVAEAAKNVQAWQPELILEKTRDSLERAFRRIERSQRHDGGWDYEEQPGHPWATAWTVLCLQRAASLAEDGSLAPPVVLQRLIRRGVGWLLKYRDRWSVYTSDIPVGGRNSVYETAVALRCLYKTESADLREVKRSVQGCIDRLLREQRPEGDWDARLSSDEPSQPTESHHEVGATSFALQALAATQREDAAVREAAGRGMEWLRQVQNTDGSWNAAVYPPYTPDPIPSLTKTCDGLKGFLAGSRLGIDLKPYQPGIDKAVKWLLEQEQAVIGDDGKIKGWGWKDSAEGMGQTLEKKTERDLLDNTCLTLETLLEIESVALPLLASNALWLIRRQVHDGDDDGKWSNDDTGRIAFALLDFYCRIKQSPLFQPAALVPAPAAAPENEATAQEGTA